MAYKLDDFRDEMRYKPVSPLVGHGKGFKIDDNVCLKFDAPIFKNRGVYLPHWYQEGTIQFITIHLHDSLPAPILERYLQLYKLIESGEFYLQTANIEKFLNKIDYWLQQGYGSCILQFDKFQKVIKDSLEFYDGIFYDLYDYVIMPNHIHFMFLPYKDHRDIISSFKRYTTSTMNKFIPDFGQVWQNDYFDKIISSVGDYYITAEYIKMNPKGWKKH